ncbi:hypothetical protein [Stutzerimonas sp. R75]|uniref:hypothetical protein n=1 Tax=Stutzerimonas sp. R75 TaxID=3439498 RepID=UPI00406C95A1
MKKDRHLEGIIRASEKLKADKAKHQKQATATPIKKEMTQAEIDRYVQVIAKAAEGFVPPQAQHQPNTSLLDQIIIERLEAMGLRPAIHLTEVHQ